MPFFFSIIGAIFLFVNARIVISDFKHKKIPNRELAILLILLPFFYAYFFISGVSFSILTFVFQIVFSVVVSFFLYYHGVWSAGDAKYLLILSWYLPTIGIIPFLGNLALITIIYLLWYYCYFYVSVLFRGKHYKNALFENIRKDRTDALNVFLQNQKAEVLEKKRIVYRILRFCFIFLVFFASIRLARFYALDELRTVEVAREYLLRYPTYAVGIFWAVFLGILFGLRKMFVRVEVYIHLFFERKGYSWDVKLFATLAFAILLAFFVFSEYIKNPTDTIHRLFLVFTLYLGLYFILRILFYSYRIVFHLGEQDTIPIAELQFGDIVDKEFLVKLLGTQEVLWYGRDSGILAPNPGQYFGKMDNPIDEESCSLIKAAYTQVNEYHIQQKTPGFQELENVRILKMFSFWAYVFVGFLVTCFFGDTWMSFVVRMIESGFRAFH